MKMPYLSAVALLLAQAAYAFEILPLVDESDWMGRFDIESPTGVVQMLDEVLKVHPTTVLWRDKGAGRMWYASREEASDYSESPMDKRVLPIQSAFTWARLERPYSRMLQEARAACLRRSVGFGLHTGYEENHQIPCTESYWNVEHPQFTCRARNGAPRLANASLAFPEVMAHKLRLVDERLALKPEAIFLDFHRAGGWSVDLEYVAPMREEWRRLHGCDVPESADDERWIRLCSKYTMAYLRAFSAKCRAAGVRFLLGIQRLDMRDEYMWKRYAVDWKQLAAEGALDGLVVMGVRPEQNRAFDSTREILAYAKSKCGAARMYFQASSYNSNNGFNRYKEWTGLSTTECMKKMIGIAKEVGCSGVILECVDPGHYAAPHCDILNEARQGERAAPADECLVEGVNGALSPDGRFLAFQRDAGEDTHVGVMRLEDGRIAWAERGRGRAAFPAWTRDGELLYSFGCITNGYFANWLGQLRQGFSIRMYARGTVREVVSGGRWYDYSPVADPDGKRVWFCSSRWDPARSEKEQNYVRAGIWSASLDGSVAPKMHYGVNPNSPGGVSQFALSPDGRSCVWPEMSDWHKQWELVTASTTDFTKRRTLTPPDMAAYAPAWSPDGKLIAFTGFRDGDGTWSVYLLDVASGGVKRLCQGANPSFAPDSKSLVYDFGGRILRHVLKPGELPGAGDAPKIDNPAWFTPEKVVWRKTDGVKGARFRFSAGDAPGATGTVFARVRFKWNGDKDARTIVDSIDGSYFDPYHGFFIFITSDNRLGMCTRMAYRLWTQVVVSDETIEPGREYEATGIRADGALFISVNGARPKRTILGASQIPLGADTEFRMSNNKIDLVSAEIGLGWPTNVQR